jgi:hypothetical protein
MRTLRVPDSRITIAGRTSVFMYQKLRYDEFAVDEVMLVEDRPYVILGLDSLYTMMLGGAYHVGLHVRPLDNRLESG